MSMFSCVMYFVKNARYHIAFRISRTSTHVTALCSTLNNHCDCARRQRTVELVEGPGASFMDLRDVWPLRFAGHSINVNLRRSWIERVPAVPLGDTMRRFSLSLRAHLSLCGGWRLRGWALAAAVCGLREWDLGEGDGSAARKVWAMGTLCGAISRVSHLGTIVGACLHLGRFSIGLRACVCPYRPEFGDRATPAAARPPRSPSRRPRPAPARATHNRNHSHA